jgi:hypothetical protein
LGFLALTLLALTPVRGVVAAVVLASAINTVAVGANTFYKFFYKGGEVEGKGSL